MSGVWLGLVVALAVVLGRRALRELPAEDARGQWIALAVALALGAAALGGIWWVTHRPPAPAEPPPAAPPR